MKKIISGVLAVVLSVSLLSVPGMAADIENSNLQKEGTQLLEELLSEQFNSYKSGKLIDTSNIFLESDSTTLYNQYLYWYTGLTKATGEYWTDYNYDLRFDSIDGDVLKFTADLSYGRTCSRYNSEASNFPYTIRVIESDGNYRIADIDTDEPNFYGFKLLVCDGFADYSETPMTRAADAVPFATVSETTVSTTTVDSLINDYVEFKEQCDDMVIDPNDVVDMEASYAEYLESGNADEPMVTSLLYGYDRERGRRYADLYYANGNSCFFKVPDSKGDCTNWVSQCVWAAYGGWSDGETAAKMAENISARKRMQPSTVMSNWFGHKNGVSDPWGNVSNFWNFVTSSPATGPRATGKNDGKPWSGAFVSTDIVTGQVLQVRKPSQTKYQHSVFVTGGTNDSFANIKITQHTPYNRIMLDEFIRNWGSNCYIRQLVFGSAYFDK